MWPGTAPQQERRETSSLAVGADKGCARWRHTGDVEFASQQLALLSHMDPSRHSRQTGDPLQRLRLSARESQLVDDIVSILHSVAAFACFDCDDDAPSGAWEESSVASSDSDSSFKTARSSHDEQRASGLEALLVRMRSQVADAQQPASGRPTPRRRRSDAVGSQAPREEPRRVGSNHHELSCWPAARQAARVSPAAPERHDEAPVHHHQASPSVAPRFPAALSRSRQRGRW